MSNKQNLLQDVRNDKDQIILEEGLSILVTNAVSGIYCAYPHEIHIIGYGCLLAIGLLGITKEIGFKLAQTENP